MLQPGGRVPSGRTTSAVGTLGHPYGPLPRGGGGNACAATDSKYERSPSEGTGSRPWDVVRSNENASITRLLPDSALHARRIVSPTFHPPKLITMDSGRVPVSGRLTARFSWRRSRSRARPGLSTRQLGPFSCHGGPGDDHHSATIPPTMQAPASRHTAIVTAIPAGIPRRFSLTA